MSDKARIRNWQKMYGSLYLDYVQVMNDRDDLRAVIKQLALSNQKLREKVNESEAEGIVDIIKAISEVVIEDDYGKHNASVCDALAEAEWIIGEVL